MNTNDYQWRIAGSDWKSIDQAPMVLDPVLDFMEQNHSDFLSYDSPEGKVTIRRG